MKMLANSGKRLLSFSRRILLVVCACSLLVTTYYVIRMSQRQTDYMNFWTIILPNATTSLPPATISQLTATTSISPTTTNLPTATTRLPNATTSLPTATTSLPTANTRLPNAIANLPTVTTRQPVDVTPDTGERFQRITLGEIIDKFKAKTLDNCTNICVENLHICSATDEMQLQNLTKFSILPYVPLLTQSQYILDFEKEYMSYPPVKDQKKLPDLALSRIVIKKGRNGLVNCKINEVITARVDLINGYGQHRRTGGDEVRAWVKNLQYRYVAHVEDLRNGSYKISTRCSVPGYFQLFVAVVYPREYLRTVIHQIHLGVSMFTAGRFRRGNISEATLCWPLPNIPGRPCLCNFTTVNQQSFYCGRPLDPRLTCDDWDAVHFLPLPKPQNCTPAELELIKSGTRPPTEHAINMSVFIMVPKDMEGQQTELPTCRDLNYSITWDTDKRPSGYWNRRQWVSLQCRSPDLTPEWGTRCLKNTQVWLFGDSNALRLYKVFLHNSFCKITLLEYWPKQAACVNEDLNFTIIYTPPEYPLYLHSRWIDRLAYGGVAKHIDSIPSTGKHIVIVHYYLHVVTSHLSVVYARLTAVRDAMVRLLERNPSVTIALRGPHVTYADWPDNHTVGGDSLGMFFIEMIKKIFKGLESKIMFMDGWEMTIALENAEYHPIPSVPHEMIRNLLSFKCS